MAAISRVAAGSHVTLHYRIAVRLDGNEHEVVSTFDARPATVQVGAGQFSEALEQRLIGLEEGQEADFDLAAGEAFGHRAADLASSMRRMACGSPGCSSSTATTGSSSTSTTRLPGCRCGSRYA
jgi:FKBP-type peptidyl-prolyl cis-trans isomerase SlpA